jgi:uncharacterized phage-associated protein
VLAVGHNVVNKYGSARSPARRSWRTSLTNLKAAIAYLVHRYASRYPGRPLTRTKLVKLLYLADLEAFRRVRRPLTGVKWISYYYGPFSQDILHAADQLDGRVLVQQVATQVTGQPYYRYEPLPQAELPALSEGDRGVVDVVLEQYGGMTLPNLIDAVYETEPYKRTEKLGDPIDLTGA